MTEDAWAQLWKEFEEKCDKLEHKYQLEMRKKHGEGHYHMSHEEHWEMQKKLIQKLVEEKSRG